jgi:hypothetical protein
VTLALAFAEPPPPVQVSVKVVVEGTATAFEPDGASEPLQPPEALQPVAFIELQVSVTWPFAATSFAEAESVAVGGGGGVEEPPPPPQAAIVAAAAAIAHRSAPAARRAPRIVISEHPPRPARTAGYGSLFSVERAVKAIAEWTFPCP